MSATTEDDLETMPETELLALPLFNVAPGNLSRLWARHSAILHQRDMDELALERAGDSGRPYMIFRDQDPKEKRRREEEQRRQSWLAYEQAMLEIRERSDRLLARIEEQERIIENRQKEIDDNAIRLHDGRRVYVDGDHFRDGEGKVLTGAVADESRERHRDKPDASTWRDKQEIDRQAEEMTRLRERVLKQRSEAEEAAQGRSPEELESRKNQAGQTMTAYEKEFNDKVETTRADLATKPQADLTAAYSADYADLDGGNLDTVRTTSYAKTQDGAGATLTGNFTAVAKGQGVPAKEKAPQPSGGVPKVQT